MAEVRYGAPGIVVQAGGQSKQRGTPGCPAEALEMIKEQLWKLSGPFFQNLVLSKVCCSSMIYSLGNE